MIVVAAERALQILQPIETISDRYQLPFTATATSSSTGVTWFADSSVGGCPYDTAHQQQFVDDIFVNRQSPPQELVPTTVLSPSTAGIWGDRVVLLREGGGLVVWGVGGGRSTPSRRSLLGDFIATSSDSMGDGVSSYGGHDVDSLLLHHHTTCFLLKGSCWRRRGGGGCCGRTGGSP